MHYWHWPNCTNVDIKIRNLLAKQITRFDIFMILISLWQYGIILLDIFLRTVTIRAIVGIRVLNKTSEEYWFLMKFKLSQLGENPAMKEHNIMTDYFLVRLQIASR